MLGLRKSLIVISLVLFCGVVNAQNIKKPKLVVGVVLENFNPDYLLKYSNQFTEGGFSRLVNEGVYFKNAYYPYFYSQTGVDQATISSGTTPSVHGIISHAWYNRLSKKAVDNVTERSISTDVTEMMRNYSPKKMLVKTVGDDLKLMNSFSRVFGVAMNAESSIMSAGHSADAAFWFNHARGEWTSSSYYMDSLSNWTKVYNKHLNLQYILRRGWNPLAMETTVAKSNLNYSSNFSHNLIKEFERNGSYRIIKATPYANSLVTEFAKNLIVNENLGRDNDSDILNISYSFLDYKCDDFSSYCDEKIDVLYRLDSELASLFKFIDEQVGLDNVLVVVTVSQSMVAAPEELIKRKLPGGYFDSFRAISLLKSYLNITYGSGDWIAGYDSQQIYLNRELIERRELKLRDVQDIVVDFLIQFTGINKVVSANSLSNGRFDNGVEKLIHESFNQKRSGDVLYSLFPSWINKLSDREDYVAKYSYRTKVPMFWYYKGIEHKVVNDRVSLLDIAPTMSEILEIPESQTMTGSVISL